MSSIFDSVKKATTDKIEEDDKEDSDEGKMKITKVFDFAGEAVE